MQDPIVQFPNAGFDSPEVQVEIAERMGQLCAAFADFAETCKEVWEAIVKIFTPLIDWIIEQCKVIAHEFPYLMPRHYRLTTMRRKIRRYAREI